MSHNPKNSRKNGLFAINNPFETKSKAKDVKLIIGQKLWFPILMPQD